MIPLKKSLSTGLDTFSIDLPHNKQILVKYMHSKYKAQKPLNHILREKYLFNFFSYIMKTELRKTKA